MKPYRVTYCDFETGREVAPDGAVRMSGSDVLALMDEILTSPGCFVSVTVEDGAMIQFFVDDEGLVCLELPVPRQRGHYGMQTTLDACKKVFRELGNEVRRDKIEGLTFERW